MNAPAASTWTGPQWRRDRIFRISMAQLRRDFKPRAFRELQLVRLEHAGHTVHIELVEEGCPTAHGGRRRYFRCPRCSGRAQVLGCHAIEGWACPAKRCVRGWRG